MRESGDLVNMELGGETEATWCLIEVTEGRKEEVSRRPPAFPFTEMGTQKEE